MSATLEVVRVVTCPRCGAGAGCIVCRYCRGAGDVEIYAEPAEPEPDTVEGEDDGSTS